MTCRYECIARAGCDGIYRPFSDYLTACRIHPTPRPSRRIGRGGRRDDGGVHRRDGDEGNEYPGNCQPHIKTDPENRGVMTQCSSGRIRFARRGGNRGAGREDWDAVNHLESNIPGMSGRMLKSMRRFRISFPI